MLPMGENVMTRSLCGLGTAIVLALPAMVHTIMAPTVMAQTQKQAPKIGDPPEALNVRLVGQNDLQGRTAYQPTIVKQGTRYIAYIGHHRGRGDFSQPHNPLTPRNELTGTPTLHATHPHH